MKIKITLLVVSLIIMGVAGSCYYRYSTQNPSTDDAYVSANIVFIAAEVNGKVLSLNTDNLETVQQGQLLLSIDPSQYQNAVKQATAQWQLQQAQQAADSEAVQVAQSELLQAQAKLFVAKQKAMRISALVADRSASPEAGDEAEGNLKIAQASAEQAEQEILQSQQNLAVRKMQVDASKAALSQAQLNLTRTILYAPTSGTVENFNLRPGAMVNAGENLFAIIDTQQWWVVANYKETELAHIRLGQKAVIHLDMYPNDPIIGTVGYISNGSGDAFSLLPAENGSGNWVKVTQRFPVKIFIDAKTLDARYPLRVGATAAVRVMAS